MAVFFSGVEIQYWQALSMMTTPWKYFLYYWPFVQGISGGLPSEMAYSVKHGYILARLNKLLNKQCSCPWFKKVSSCDWHHCHQSPVANSWTLLAHMWAGIISWQIKLPCSKCIQNFTHYTFSIHIWNIKVCNHLSSQLWVFVLEKNLEGIIMGPYSTQFNTKSPPPVVSWDRSKTRWSVQSALTDAGYGAAWP